MLAIYEYLSRLCQGDSTHVLFVLDWYALLAGQITPEHINQEDPWWELKLDDHRGWSRMNCVNTGVAEFCVYFSQQKS